MLNTTPTYALRTEAIKHPSPFGEGLVLRLAPKRMFCVIGGG